MGENYARSLGGQLKRTTLGIIITTSILAGAITAFAGPIAFIGLAVPHITRQWITSSDHKVLIPAVLLFGSIIGCFLIILAGLSIVLVIVSTNNNKNNNDENEDQPVNNTQAPGMQVPVATFTDPTVCTLEEGGQHFSCTAPGDIVVGDNVTKIQNNIHCALEDTVVDAEFQFRARPDDCFCYAQLTQGNQVRDCFCAACTDGKPNSGKSIVGSLSFTPGGLPESSFK